MPVDTPNNVIDRSAEQLQVMSDSLNILTRLVTVSMQQHLLEGLIANWDICKRSYDHNSIEVRVVIDEECSYPSSSILVFRFNRTESQNLEELIPDTPECSTWLNCIAVPFPLSLLSDYMVSSIEMLERSNPASSPVNQTNQATVELSPVASTVEIHRMHKAALVLQRLVALELQIKATLHQIMCWQITDTLYSMNGITVRAVVTLADHLQVPAIFDFKRADNGALQANSTECVTYLCYHIGDTLPFENIDFLLELDHGEQSLGMQAMCRVLNASIQASVGTAGVQSCREIEVIKLNESLNKVLASMRNAREVFNNFKGEIDSQFDTINTSLTELEIKSDNLKQALSPTTTVRESRRIDFTL